MKRASFTKAIGIIAVCVVGCFAAMLGLWQGGWFCGYFVLWLFGSLILALIYRDKFSAPWWWPCLLVLLVLVVIACSGAVLEFLFERTG